MIGLLLRINTLTSNDNDSLKEVLKKILKQQIIHQIQLLFVDQSKENNHKYINNKIANLITKRLQKFTQIIINEKKENGIYYLLQTPNLKQKV